MNDLEVLFSELERYRQKYENERREKLNYKVRLENCEKERAKLKNELASVQMVTDEILRENEHLQHEVVILQTRLNSLNINQKEEELFQNQDEALLGAFARIHPNSKPLSCSNIDNKKEEVDRNQDEDLLNAFAWIQQKQKPCAPKVVRRPAAGVWQSKSNRMKADIRSLETYILEIDAKIASRKDQIERATGDCKRAKGFYGKQIGELYQERRNITNQISELKFESHNPYGNFSDEIDLHELSCALALQKVRPWLENVFGNRGKIVTGKGRGKVNNAIVKLLKKKKYVHIESNNGTYICISRK